MRRFTSRGQRRVNAHQITSRRKLLPSPLSPVTRFTRGAKSSPISGAGPTLSSFKCSIIALPRPQALPIPPLTPERDATAHARSRHCRQARFAVDAILSAIIARRDTPDSIERGAPASATDGSPLRRTHPRHLNEQHNRRDGEGACVPEPLAISRHRTCPQSVVPEPACRIGADSVIVFRPVDHRNLQGEPPHGNPSRGRLRGGQAAYHRDRHPRRTAGRRGAGRDQGHRHLPHRRVHPLRRRPRGALPRHPRTRGRGRGGGGRRGRDQREARRPRHPALHSRVPPVRLLPERQDQPLPGDPRDPGARRDARRHQPLPSGQGPNLPLHGDVDVRQPHRAAGNRGGQGPRGRALRQDLLHRVRRHHRDRRGDQHREGRARLELRGLRARRHRAQRHPGPAPGRGRHHRRLSTSIPPSASSRSGSA